MANKFSDFGLTNLSPETSAVLVRERITSISQSFLGVTNSIIHQARDEMLFFNSWATDEDAEHKYALDGTNIKNAWDYNEGVVYLRNHTTDTDIGTDKIIGVSWPNECKINIDIGDGDYPFWDIGDVIEVGYYGYGTHSENYYITVASSAGFDVGNWVGCNTSGLTGQITKIDTNDIYLRKVRAATIPQIAETIIESLTEGGATTGTSSTVTTFGVKENDWTEDMLFKPEHDYDNSFAPYVSASRNLCKTMERKSSTNYAEMGYKHAKVLIRRKLDMQWIGGDAEHAVLIFNIASTDYDYLISHDTKFPFIMTELRVTSDGEHPADDFRYMVNYHGNPNLYADARSIEHEIDDDGSQWIIQPTSTLTYYGAGHSVWNLKTVIRLNGIQSRDIFIWMYSGDDLTGHYCIIEVEGWYKPESDDS